jgi:hypothetical protein
VRVCILNAFTEKLPQPRWEVDGQLVFFEVEPFMRLDYFEHEKVL